MFKRKSFLRHQRVRKTVGKLILAEQRLLADERRTSKGKRFADDVSDLSAGCFICRGRKLKVTD